MTIVKFIHGVVRTISSARVFGLMVGLLIVSAAVAEARPYRLAWDRNSDSVTVGYRVYYGTAPGAYQPSAGIDVGNVQEFTVDLDPGRTYFFTVRGYSSGSQLGPSSAELSFAVPLNATVSVNTASLSMGGTVTATIAHGPGNRLDWVGFFPSGAPATGWTDWKYLNGTRTASATGTTGGTVTFTAPNTPGTYEVRFYTDARVLLGTSVPITVAGSTSITAPSSATSGQNFTVTVSNGPASRYDWVALYPAGSTSASGYLDWKFLNGTQSAPAMGVANASVTFTAPAQAGQYVVRFLYNGGSTVLATSGIITVSSVVTPPPAPPPPSGAAVTSSVATIAAGGSFLAQITNGPGGRFDWVALFPAGASNTIGNVQWYYLNGSRTAPAVGLRNANVPFVAPSQAGQYNLRFFANDGFSLLATSAAITVTTTAPPPPTTPPPSATPTVTPSATSVAPGANVTAQVTNGPAGRTDWVGLFRVGAGPSEFLDYFYLNGTKSAPATGVATANVVFRMPTEAGQYNLRLMANDSYTTLATSATITVGTTSPPTSSNPTVTPSVTTAAPGQLINVTIANGPGGRYDWVGIYVPNLGGAEFADWVFLNGTKVAPATGLRNTTFSLRMPTTARTYVLRFYANNSFSELLANSVEIVVR